MATGGAAAIPVPAGGVGVPAVNIMIPEVPDLTALTSVMGTPGGIAAALLDLYGHMRQLGQSATTALQSHMSSNNVTHDMLDAETPCVSKCLTMEIN